VLVHGAWAGPSGWDDVEAGLHKDGYTTVTATVRATLDSIPGKKVLVGHSYGGADISNAAYERSDVLGLVYTAAFVPDEGQTLLQLGEGYQPPAALPHLIFSGPPFASPSLIDPAYFREDFAQDLNPKLAATLSAQQRPTDFSIFVTPSGPVAWHSLPSWYAVSGADRMIDPALQRAMAQRIGATTGEEPRPLPRVTRSLTLKIRRKEAQTGKGSGSRTRTEGQTIDRQWIIVISAYSASPPASGRPLSTVA
jgi:pimeloyl-ACP methyl ester carboxylesterase